MKILITSAEKQICYIFSPNDYWELMEYYDGMSVPESYFNNIKIEVKDIESLHLQHFIYRWWNIYLTSDKCAIDWDLDDGASIEVIDSPKHVDS